MRNVQDIYPLSPTQQGLLFHSLLAPGTGIYVPQVILTLSGSLDADHLRSAWERALQRHTVLRTGFQWEQREEAFQVVYREAPLNWVEHDWSSSLAEEQAAKLKALRAANRTEPFDLHRPSLMRLHLIHCSDKGHFLLWCYHHLILDGWSASRVLKEILEDYLISPIGTSLAPSQPPKQSRYAEYIAWLKQQDSSLAESFWKQRLASSSNRNSVSEALADVSTHNERLTGMGEAVMELSLTDTGELRAFAKANALTLNTILLGSFGLLLNRYHDEREILLGTTVSGRPSSLPNAMSMVGLFINTLPVRVQLNPTLSIKAWLRAIQYEQSEAAPFEHVSLRDIQTWTNDGKPLFDCLFVLESYPVPTDNSGSASGLQLENVDFDEWTHFPLTFLAFEGDHLVFKAKYQEPRFAKELIESLLSQVKLVIQQLVRQAHLPVSHVGLLSEADSVQRTSWNHTESKWADEGTTLGDLMAKHAASESVAVSFKGETMSHCTLHQRAEQLARRLRSYQVGPETQVAIYLERGLNLPIAILATLKAGAAYVPLDPSYPRQRLQDILDDVCPVVLVFDECQGLPSLETGGVLVNLADPQEDTELSGDGSPIIMPENAAYVIYTSGSTGRPKGVVNTHKAIVNRLLWMQERYQLTSSDRVLQKTPVGFDVSVWEFYWPMITGASLVEAEPEQHKDSRYLVDTIQRENITAIHFVPPMLDAFLEEPEVGDCQSLRRIICSGDTLTLATQARCFERLRHVELHNLYGPTEAAIDVTSWSCEPEPHATTVPIGKPIANTSIHIVDRDMNEVPAGVEGELHIGGLGLARGYFNRADLTAECFIPNPFRSDGDRNGSETLYRSGDRARYRADGAIEFLGRKDHQIKIRGQRIELAEIDAAITQHPGVHQAMSTLHPSRAEIVAYLTLTPNKEALLPEDPVASFRTFLQSHLTDAMIPGQFVILPEFTLTANGKIDRDALPPPEEQLGREYAPPQTSTEKAIAEIWAEVLKIDEIGLADHFFELGGHSLSATRANTRLRTHFRIDLQLRELFEHPVLTELATHIDALLVKSESSTTVSDSQIEIEI